ncbi:hypothetical protein [Planomonospora sp. ID67723]|nr:hypothetical protein [Planomonospora sp. ID67723]
MQVLNRTVAADLGAGGQAGPVQVGVDAEQREKEFQAAQLPAAS